MADVYGGWTGRPGVCLATTGPGATNLSGVGGALRDSSSMIVSTCNNTADLGRTIPRTAFRRSPNRTSRAGGATVRNASALALCWFLAGACATTLRGLRTD